MQKIQLDLEKVLSIIIRNLDNELNDRGECYELVIIEPNGTVTYDDPRPDTPYPHAYPMYPEAFFDDYVISLLSDIDMHATRLDAENRVEQENGKPAEAFESDDWDKVLKYINEICETWKGMARHETKNHISIKNVIGDPLGEYEIEWLTQTH